MFSRVEFISRRGWSVCLWVLFSGFMALGLALPVLNAAPQEQEKPSKAEKRRQKAIQKELESPYKKWLTEEVPYIITSEERASFKKLSTDDEREQFIENFWERRNPNPGSLENEFKEEYYRRIAYANEHYASGIPGWRTDRGRIYIMYGPPDENDSHPSGAATFDLRKRVAARPPLSPSSNGGIVILRSSSDRRIPKLCWSRCRQYNDTAIARRGKWRSRRHPLPEIEGSCRRWGENHSRPAGRT